MIVSDGWPSLLNETRVALGIKVWCVSTLTAGKGLAKDFIGSKRCHQLHREFYERQPDKNSTQASLPVEAERFRR